MQTSGARLLRRLERPARLIVVAACFGWAGYVLASWLLLWNPADAGAYYDAASRLVEGGELYPASHPDAHEVFRYAPWFAYAWIPMTVLPRDVALHVWSVAMLGCTLVAVWPLLTRGTAAAISLGALLGAFLAETAMFGNAHPAVVALLVVTARSSWFPVAAGVATSIKLAPILFVTPWLWRRRWSKAAGALAVATVLWAPALLFDLSGYVTDPGSGLLSLYAVSPWVWLAVALVSGAVAAVAVASGSRYAWVALAFFMFLGPPRVALSYLGFLAPAIVLTWAEEAAEAE